MHKYIFHKPRFSKFQLFSFSVFIFMLIICWPAATWLQSKKQWASPEKPWDAIYLVCGARAQNNRIKALDLWMQQRSEVGGQRSAVRGQGSYISYIARNERNIQTIASPLSTNQQSTIPLPINSSTITYQPLPSILIGNDPQKGLWCRKHQTNHTVSAWAVEKISDLRFEISNNALLTTNHQQKSFPITPSTINHQLLVIPGSFSNTDGEMQVLANYLAKHAEIESIALVTSRYHARRAQQRLEEHLDYHITIGIIPGIERINNRNPIIVILEYLKIARDKLGLSHAPIISRPKTVDD